MAQVDKVVEVGRYLNSELYNFLNSVGTRVGMAMMEEVLQDEKIQEKIVSALSYYTSFTKKESNPKKTEEWVKKFAEKELGGTTMNFVVSLAEEWNLDKLKTLEVIDGFFLKHESIFKQVKEAERVIQKEENKMPKERYWTETEKYLESQKDKMTNFYYQERKYLMKIIIFIFVFESSQNAQIRTPTSSIIQKCIEKDLLKTLVSCLNDNIAVKNDKVNENAYLLRLTYQLMEEEELLLQCILSIFCGFTKEVKNIDEVKNELFNYFVENDFQGYYFNIDSEMTITEDYEKIFKKENSIQNITIFTSLFCLSVNERNLQKSDGLVKTINQTLKLKDEVTVTILKFAAHAVYHCLQINNQKGNNCKEAFDKNLIKEFEKSQDRSCFLIAICGLLESHILSEESYDFIRGPLINCVKQLFDKFSDTDLIQEFQNMEELTVILYNLIKEPYILSEFWKFDYQMKTPFFKLIKEKYLIGFPHELSKFCDISYRLCGEEENDFAPQVIDFFRNFDSLVIPNDKSIKTTSVERMFRKERNEDSDQEEFEFELVDEVDRFIRIPQGTVWRYFPQRRECLEFKTNYDLWPVLFKKWRVILEKSTDYDNSEDLMRCCRDEIETASSFVSQILINGPERVADLSTEIYPIVLKSNLEAIVKLLLKSLNQIKVLFQILRDEEEQSIKRSLKAISKIISAIGSLYSQPVFRKVVAQCLDMFEKDLENTEKPYGSTYSNFSKSNHNRLITLFKELNNTEQNYLVEDFYVTKAISKLGPMIMSDPYPPIFLVQMLDVLKSLKFKMNTKNFEIYLNLLETYKHVLLKFRTCPTKANYNLKDVQNDEFFEVLKRFLDDSDVHNILEEILELEKNEWDIFAEGSSYEPTKTLPFVNKIYIRYKEKCWFEDIILIKSMIITALECLDIILQMIHTLIVMKKNEKLQTIEQNLHQFHISHLNVVKYIKEALLSNLSFMTDIWDNKLLLTIASYINFESRYEIQTYERKLKVQDNSNMVVSYNSLLNVSSISLRCMTQIIKIWELYPVSRRPLLSSYLGYEENGFKDWDTIISRFLINPEETNELLKFLVCCTNSQTAFINGLFKNPKLFKSINDTFWKHPENIIREAKGNRNKNRVVGMLIILVSELLQNSKVKGNKRIKEGINTFLDAYIFNGIEIVQDLFIDKKEFRNQQLDMSIKSIEFRKKNDTLEYCINEGILEQEILDVCFYNHVVSSYLLIISNLLISLQSNQENKAKALKLVTFLNKGTIHEILTQWTTKRLTSTGDVLREFFAEFAKLGEERNLDFNNDLSEENRKVYMPITDKSDLLLNIAQLQYIHSDFEHENPSFTWRPEEQGVFRKNIYAYGRSFILDRNELYYMLQSSGYDSSLIRSFTTILGKYNLEMSLIDSERNLISNIHNQFAFLSSLGHDGFLGSNHERIPTSIKKSSNEVNYGFSFFTIVGGFGSKIKRKEFSKWKSKLIDKVGTFANQIWESIKNDLEEYNEFYVDMNEVIGGSFRQKIDFLKTIFKTMVYLGSLEYSEIDEFEGGVNSGRLPSVDKNFNLDDEQVSSVIVNISSEIICRLSQLLYARTRFRSELPTEEFLLENMFDFIPTFLHNVTLLQVMTESNQRLDQSIVEFAKNLRHLLDYKNDRYYNSIVLVYEQLLKIIGDKYEIKGIFGMRESVVIKNMLAKITQTNWTESQYLSTLKFMIAYSSDYERALHLFEERVIPALISAHWLKTLNDHEHYEVNERNTKHILWLWTLHLMRQLTSMLVNNSEYTYSMINFIFAFEKKIISALKFKGYIDGKKQFHSFSIAKLEEIEHIVNFISFWFLSYDQWKSQNEEQVDYIVHVLFGNTIDLFQPNISLKECFHPISKFEKYISNLSGTAKDFEESKSYDKFGADIGSLRDTKSDSVISQTHKEYMNDKIMTSLRTPMKGETSLQSDRLYNHDKFSKKAYKSKDWNQAAVNAYNPSAYFFKVEMTLSKIALMLLKSMYLVLKHETKLGSRSHFIKKLSYYHENNNETRLFIMNAAIFDSIEFSLHCQEKWSRNLGNVERLVKVLNGTNQFSESILDSGLETSDIFQISLWAAKQGILLCMMLIKANQFSKEDSFDKNYQDTVDPRLTNKIKKFETQIRDIESMIEQSLITS